MPPFDSAGNGYAVLNIIVARNSSERGGSLRIEAALLSGDTGSQERHKLLERLRHGWMRCEERRD
ncbi:MAG: hypothetical protein DMG30_11425 [Acidobacteria bacterium]|nr:MAG: hypothetical protein DMG30_11425 [Acidobacteriota bacterium]